MMTRQEQVHEALAQIVSDLGEPGILSAWVLVIETRDPQGEAHIGYIRGPALTASWVHRGMMREADEMIAGDGAG